MSWERVHAMTSSSLLLLQTAKSEEGAQAGLNSCAFAQHCYYSLGNLLFTNWERPYTPLSFQSLDCLSSFPRVIPSQPRIIMISPTLSKGSKGQRDEQAVSMNLELQDLLGQDSKSPTSCVLSPVGLGMQEWIFSSEPMGSSYSHRSLWWWRVTTGCSGNAQRCRPQQPRWKHWRNGKLAL